MLGKERVRELEVDSFFSSSAVKDVSRFVNRKMEWLQHRAALQAVERLYDGGFVLLDGTLYGRMVAVPRDSAAEGQKDFMLRYFEDYTLFLDTCKERGVVHIGVSKDSRSSFLRDHLLTLLLEDSLKELGLESPCGEKIRKTFSDLLDRNRREPTHRDEFPKKVELIMRGARSSIMDHQLITNFIKSEGYSVPLELGVVGRGKLLVRQYIESPLIYLHNHFTEAYDESRDKTNFLEWGRRVLSKIPKLPTVVSFHVLFDKRDSPLRIDVPSWVFGKNNTLSDKVGIMPVDPESDRIKEVVSVLRGGYGGLRNYNVMLVQAHKEVKIKHTTMDKLYRWIMEKELGLLHPLMLVRRERRVGYE